MRIISCHIENFGKLHDSDHTFSKGLNVICRENGWGKSTLAAFIKAMLYGLDGNKKRDLDENERKRFTPWQGGIFGGRMEFEVGTKKYVVSRTFGDSPIKDTFELRDGVTNLISHDYSERLGEELFKLNSASFFRSIFIAQSDCKTSTTDDIHAKIGNLTDNTGDIDSFEAADERLKKQLNSLSPRLRAGSLSRLSLEIAELRRKVADGKNLAEKIADCENRIAQAEKNRLDAADKRDSLEAEQGQILKLHELKTQKTEWERLTKQRDAIKNQLNEIRTKFPAGIPDEDSIREAMHAAVEMKSAESLMNSYRLSEYEEQRWEELKDTFRGSTPSAQDIDFCLKDAQELRRITEKYRKLDLTDDEREKYDRLAIFFAEDTVTPTELMAKWNERCIRKNALPPRLEAFDTINASVMRPRKRVKRRAFILIGAGCTLLATGFTFFIMYFAPWFLAAAVLGIFLLAAGIFFAVLTPGDIPEKLKQFRSDIRNDEIFIDDVDELMGSYLNSHGMEYNKDVIPNVLQELCGDRRDLDHLLKKKETAEGYLQVHDPTSLREKITGFLGRFGLPPDEENLSEQLHELKESAAEFISLSEKNRSFYEAQNRHSQKSSIISDFLTSSGFDNRDNIQTTLERIRDDIAETGILSDNFNEAEAELNAFEQSHDIETLISFDSDSLPSIESINEKIKECGKTLEEIGNSIASLRQNRDELYTKYSEWESDGCMLEMKTAKEAEDRLKYDRLIKTRELLRTAKENMVVRYVAPISDSFMKYYEILAGEPADHFHIDADINITVDELGKQREIKTLSAGFRDLTGICLRLSLADAMYKGEKPTLIMDDPFTNLDDDKVAASRTLMNAVSEKYQVICFTCSASRADFFRKDTGL